MCSRFYFSWPFSKVRLVTQGRLKMRSSTHLYQMTCKPLGFDLSCLQVTHQNQYIPRRIWVYNYMHGMTMYVLKQSTQCSQVLVARFSKKKPGLSHRNRPKMNWISNINNLLKKYFWPWIHCVSWTIITPWALSIFIFNIY